MQRINNVKQLMVPVFLSIVLGIALILVVEFIPYSKKTSGVNLENPLSLFWITVFSSLLLWVFKSKRLLFLLFLPVAIYLLAYVGYFSQRCGCGFRFEYNPFSVEPLCNHYGCIYEYPLTKKQKLINRILLKKVVETPDIENFAYRGDYVGEVKFDKIQLNIRMSDDYEYGFGYKGTINTPDEYYEIDKFPVFYNEDQSGIPIDNLYDSTKTLLWYANGGRKKARNIKVVKMTEYEGIIEVYVEIDYAGPKSQNVNFWTIPKTDKKIKWIGAD